MKSLTNRISQAKLDGKFIGTKRLVLLPLQVTDASQMFKWCGDCEVTKYMRYSPYDNVEKVKDFLKDNGYRIFGFFLREDGQLIGCGETCKDENGCYELGFNLAKSYWGKGYSTEACKGLLAWNVEHGINDFVCHHAVDNVRSGRVIRKCGFVNAGEGSYTCFDGIRTFKSLKYTLHIASCEMNVDEFWFDKIANGSKTIELRLNDERRRAIKTGDYIVLNNLGSNADIKKCVAQVTALHKFGDFKTLYENLDMTKCGYSANETPNFEDMLRYYSEERQAEYGVVGAEFELFAFCNDSKIYDVNF